MLPAWSGHSMCAGRCIRLIILSSRGKSALDARPGRSRFGYDCFRFGALENARPSKKYEYDRVATHLFLTRSAIKREARRYAYV